MGQLGTAYENYALDAILGSGFTPPSTVYVALFTVLPVGGTPGTEVFAASYVRQPSTNDATNWPAATGGQKTNGLLIQFSVTTEDWGTVVAFGLFDAVTAGSLVCWGEVTQKPVALGTQPEFIPGSLVITAT